MGDWFLGNGHNSIQTCGTATVGADLRGGTRTDTQIRRSTSKDAHGSTCTDDLRSVCTDVSTDSTGLNRSTCLFIPTKGMGVHGVTYTDVPAVNTVVFGRTKAFGNYGSYKII